MGGRGASSRRSTGVMRQNSKPVELENSKSYSGGGRWKHTILEAKATGGDTIDLSYATPKSYEHPNRNTTVAKYELSHGVWSSQTGDRSPHSTGINWDNVKAVTGRTFDVQGYLKDKGFKWNRATRRYER